MTNHASIYFYKVQKMLRCLSRWIQLSAVLFCPLSFARDPMRLIEAKQFLESSAPKKVELLKVGKISVEDVFDLFETLQILNEPRLQNDSLAGWQILIQISLRLTSLNKRVSQPTDLVFQTDKAKIDDLNTTSVKGNLLTVLTLLCAKHFSEFDLKTLSQTIERTYDEIIAAKGRQCQIMLIDSQTLSSLTDFKKYFMTVFEQQKLLPIL